MNDTGLLHGPFWKVSIGQVGTGIIILIGLFIGFGRISEKFDSLSGTVKESRDRISAMDQNGTQASTRKLDVELMTVNSHEQRLMKIEDAISNIKVMQEQINGIRDDVKVIKDGGGRKQ